MPTDRDRGRSCLGGLAWLTAVAVIIQASGCGRPLPTTARVSGLVTLAGKPVNTGMVMFHPEQGRAAIGPIGSDGRYTLTTFRSGDGAVLGRHRVTIEVRTLGAGGAVERLPMTLEEAPKPSLTAYPSDPRVTWIVPEQYSLASTTPLTADVKPGSNTIDFAVP